MCERRARLEPEGVESEAGAHSFHLGYRPYLDGLRGIAVLLVLLIHMWVPSVAAEGAGASFVGVNVFFVLSGFLITSLLLSEWQSTGGISLPAFYYRRALRLLPAFGAMLLAFLVWAFWHKGQPAVREIAADAIAPVLYVANWTKAFGSERPVLFAHTWSLSIEEQFYLFWPVTLGFLLKRRISPGSLIRVLLCAIYVVIILRLLMVTGGASFSRVFHGTDTRADALLMGCLLAVLLSFHFDRMRALQPWVLSVGGLCAAAALAAFCLRWDFHRPLAQVVFYPLTSLAACVLLLDLLLSGRSVARAFLLSRPLVWLGKMSYGLYLWHVPVFFLLIKPGAPAHHPWFGLLIAGAATILSYYLVELPCLKLKNRRRAPLFPTVQPLCPPVERAR